jgi:hypothetical protein
MLHILLSRTYHLLILIALALTASSAASAPHIALSTVRRSTSNTTLVTVNMSYSQGEPRLVALQWDISYVPAHLMPATPSFYTSSPATKASGKEVACRVVSEGNLRCLLIGLNTSVVVSGMIASLTFQILDIGVKSSLLNLTNVAGAAADSTRVLLIGQTRKIEWAQ